MDPQTVFGAAPGELFVVRNVAGLVPPYQPDNRLHGTSAAIEYAVRVLKVKRVVVLGHGNCGGVRAMIDGVPDAAGDFVEAVRAQDGCRPTDAGGELPSSAVPGPEPPRGTGGGGFRSSPGRLEACSQPNS